MLALMGSGSFLGTTEGQKLVARFCAAALQGKTQDQADAESMARALLPIIGWDGDTRAVMADVAENLGITQKQGKALAQERQHNQHVWSVARYLDLWQRLIDEAMHPDKAQLEARRRTADKYGIKDRAMRNRIAKHEAEASDWLDSQKRLAMAAAEWLRKHDA